MDALVLPMIQRFKPGRVLRERLAMSPSVGGTYNWQKRSAGGVYHRWLFSLPYNVSTGWRRQRELGKMPEKLHDKSYMDGGSGSSCRPL